MSLHNWPTKRDTGQRKMEKILHNLAGWSNIGKATSIALAAKDPGTLEKHDRTHQRARHLMDECLSHIEFI